MIHNDPVFTRGQLMWNKRYCILWLLSKEYIFFWLKYCKSLLRRKERLILNISFVVTSSHCILVINILIVNQIWKLFNLMYEHVLYFLVLCAVILLWSHLFVNRKMMKGLHFLEKEILLLFIVYIYSEVKWNLYKF